ncbi:MAG TPA: hypothetical protein DET40_13545 [Lentisphaeria bacterium]|nr:MAG: hypothetical protein A2X45_01650 [Lentisphaerae bacterium GWF2_50_93]HCE44565.1 hypothetical protein [Lentisphaeria bacterium]
MRNALRRFILSSVLSLTVLLLGSGCASNYSFRNIDSVYTFQKFNESRLVSEKVSPDTIQYLRLNFLDQEYLQDPESVVAKLVDRFDKTGEPESVIPIAELSYCEGFRLEHRNELKSAAYYALCASFCYDYLSKGIFGKTNNISSKLLLAAGLYNSSVSRGVMLWQTSKTPWSKDLVLDLGYRKFTIAVKNDNSNLMDPSFFSRFYSSYDYEVEGFTNKYRLNGLGASIFGEHVKRDIPEDYNYPKLFFLPMTAVLEFNNKPDDKGTARSADLRFYNAMRTGSMDLGGHPFRIDADFTVPLNVYLANNDPGQFSFAGLRNPASLVARSNIFMLEPYDPDKIPVILVHGLYSSPGTFLEMYNDLIGIPEVRERCQFWFFFYPSGLPIAESSSIFRGKLKAIHEKYDPKSENENFNNMMVVGHSMGGILSKMLSQDSGDEMYNAVFKVPVDSTDFTPDEKQMLKEKMFFTHFPFIKRTVFIATPHRGSDIAIAWWARLLSRTISLPANFVNATSGVLLHKKELLREMPPEYQDIIPTSVQALSPKSIAVQVTSRLPIWKDVKYHSIIGIRGAETGPGSSDGIVPYESSHLDGALSEYLVRDSHTCVSNPYTIIEVKRLVLLHLKEIDEQKAAAREKDAGRSSTFVKFSRVMSELSKNQEFMDALMARVGRNPNAGGLMGPEEIQILKRIIFFRDFAAFDRFPGLTVKGMGISVAIAGEKAKKRKAENPEPEKQPVDAVLTENIIEDLRLPAPKDEKQPAADALLKDLGFGLQAGDKIDLSKTKTVSDSRRMAFMLNRLSLNPAEKDKPRYMVKLGEKLIDSPNTLVEELMKSGCKVEVKDARYFANFGDLFYKGMEVLTAYWLNTEIPVPGTDSSLLVPVSHSQHELHIDGADFSIELSFYFGIDGKVEFRIVDTLDQSWVLGRIARTYSGKDAVEVVRLEGEIIKTYERIKKDNPDLPFGGYYALGVCDDVNAAIEYRMTGETTLFPLPHDVKYFQGDSEVEKIMRNLPSDGRGDSIPDPKRVLGSIPIDDLSKIPMPALREHLKKVKDAYGQGRLAK